MKIEEKEIRNEALRGSRSVLRPRILFFFSVLIFVVLTNKWIVKEPWSWIELGNWWGNLADPLTGLFTFIIATWLLIAELRHRYLESLDKRLSVFFQTPKDEIIFYAHQVTLTSEGDIRQWGQQVGAQANHNPAKFGGKGGPEFLSFNSFFEIEGPKTIAAPAGNKNRFLREWSLTMFLDAEGYEFIKARYDARGITDYKSDVLILASPDYGKTQHYYWRSELLDSSTLEEGKPPLPDSMVKNILQAILPKA